MRCFKPFNQRIHFAYRYCKRSLVILRLGEYSVTPTNYNELALVSQNRSGNLFTAGSATNTAGNDRFTRSIYSSLYQSGYLSRVAIDYYHLGFKIGSVERCCDEMGVFSLLKPGHGLGHFGSDILVLYPKWNIEATIEKFGFSWQKA